MIETYTDAERFLDENPPVCQMCGNCCDEPPRLVGKEAEQLATILGAENIDGDKIRKVDGYCAAFDRETRLCSLHGIAKPIRCSAIKVCSKCFAGQEVSEAEISVIQGFQKSQF